MRNVVPDEWLGIHFEIRVDTGTLRYRFQILVTSFSLMNFMIESCQNRQPRPLIFRARRNTHPTLTLMRNTPPIESKPPSIRLLPGPLHSQVSRAHQRLSDIVKAMKNVVFSPRSQENILDLF